MIDMRVCQHNHSDVGPAQANFLQPFEYFCFGTGQPCIHKHGIFSMHDEERVKHSERQDWDRFNICLDHAHFPFLLSSTEIASNRSGAKLGTFL
jgi:hypothetical protein